MRARQCGDVVGCDKQRCMGHHDWVSKEVNERLMECDGLNATQLIRRALTSSGASTNERYSWKPVLNGTDFGLHRSLVFRVLISPKTHAMKNLTSI